MVRAEYEAGALLSERIRKRCVCTHRKQIRGGGDCIRELLKSPEVSSSLMPDDFIMVMLNLTHGLAVTQKILGAELPQKTIRKLIKSLFDHLIVCK